MRLGENFALHAATVGRQRRRTCSMQQRASDKSESSHPIAGRTTAAPAGDSTPFCRCPPYTRDPPPRRNRLTATEAGDAGRIAAGNRQNFGGTAAAERRQNWVTRVEKYNSGRTMAE